MDATSSTGTTSTTAPQGTTAATPTTGDVRSRRDRVRRAVLDTTAALVAEVGVERTTIDEVAARSGVAKTTIYRHFDSKQALVVEAVHACTALPLAADTGSLRDDLIACFGGLTKTSYEGRMGAMILSLMDAAQRDPELDRLLRAHTDQRRQVAASLIARGIERGELPADADVDLLVTLLAGPLIYTKLVRRERVTQELVVAVVDSVLAAHR